MKETVVALNKKKIIFLFFMSIVFFFLALLLLIYLPQDQGIVDYWFIKIVASLGVFLTAIAWFFVFLKIFDRKPGLVINDEWILDNSSFLSVGLIKWDNISNVAVNNIRKQKILTITLKNPDEFMEKQNVVKKFCFKLNHKYFESPVQISDSALKYDCQKIYEIIKRKIASHKT